MISGATNAPTDSASQQPRGRPRRVPGQLTIRSVRFRLTESEYRELTQAVSFNCALSIGDFCRLAVNQAVSESGLRAPIVMSERRQAERRTRRGDDQPVELDRRKGSRRR